MVAIEEGLKMWRGVVLLLTTIMLFVSLLADDDMTVIFLIISLFALILFQMPNLPTSSYQVRSPHSALRAPAGGLLHLHGGTVPGKLVREEGTHITLHHKKRLQHGDDGGVHHRALAALPTR